MRLRRRLRYSKLFFEDEARRDGRRKQRRDRIENDAVPTKTHTEGYVRYKVSPLGGPKSQDHDPFLRETRSRMKEGRKDGGMGVGLGFTMTGSSDENTPNPPKKLRCKVNPLPRDDAFQGILYDGNFFLTATFRTWDAYPGYDYVLQ